MNFNSSDVVAIVAVIVSAIVSVMSAYISYKSNKASLDASQRSNKDVILSRRTEFIFEKQVTVFKETAQKMDKILSIVSYSTEEREEKISNKKNEEKFFSDLKKEADVLLWFFNGEKFYLPKKILSAAADFLAAIRDFIDKHDYEDRRKLLKELVTINLEAENLMRTYWGIDQE